MTWQCFMVRETGEADLFLRRYRGKDEGGKCTLGWGYHNASVHIGRAPAIWKKHNDEEMYFHCDPDVKDFVGDSRWPKQCICGYEFRNEDHWQVNHEIRYRADDGREWNSRDLPIGAMFEIHWHFREWVGPDGKSLFVVLPPGRSSSLVDHWMIDGPASSGGRWTRTGIPPNINVTPSILTDKYHGFLQNGMLTDSLGDRPL